MYKSKSGLVYSASDLVTFLECEHSTTLDLLELETPLPRAPDDDETVLLQEKGLAHEKQYLEQLKAQHGTFADLSSIKSIDERIRSTIDWMRKGADVIYQGALQSGNLIGYPDFLRRVERPSGLGAHSYEVVDTKLARSAKTKFLVQLCAYSGCLAEAQGIDPLMMHVVLGDLSELNYRYQDYSRYVAQLRRRFEERLRAGATGTYPDPCEHCDLCKWRLVCEERRLADDHLCQVANITKLQTRRLQAAGVATLAALGKLPASSKIPKVNPETLGRLRNQARLQLEARISGEPKVELLDTGSDFRGFARLPRPDPGDLFFDMEGDPYEQGGLEYLFGVYFFDDGKARFRPFWAHSRIEEKVAFEQFMDFVISRLNEYPDAHIYHYAQYEPTALKRLMSLHGTREAELDNLLRRHKFVDLYKVVREGIRVSEPRYSIKNIEHFYLDKRTASVTNAGASIVYYERWKETGDPQLLKDIETYNFDDVRSTHELRNWLLKLRPSAMTWANDAVTDDETKVAAGELTEAERRLVPYREALVDGLPPERKAWILDHHIRELTYFLLDFHRRADKPAYWKMFARQEMTEEELLEDAECLAGLRRVGEPVPDKRSRIWIYEYPEQETKLRSGSPITLTSTREGLGKLDIDEDRRVVRIRRSVAKGPLPDCIALGPGAPIRTDVIRDALFRFADSLINGTQKYRACEAILRREPPRLRGHCAGEPIVRANEVTTERIADAISQLEDSYLFIQGPPGAGKTYTGSHAIVELMFRGFRVGVTSHSHKAINNLLDAVEKVAEKRGFTFHGAKKCNDDEDCLNGKFIQDVFKNEEIEGGGEQLVAGTAWLFSRPAFDQDIDFLFVDEAGQVSLANVIAVGTSARNIVLLGDQMQLGQPIQGVHPGSSGDSSLEYLLEGKATITPDRGIFLGTTWRMHPDVCRFISDAVYDSRLEPEAHNKNRVLVLGPHAHPALKPAGIRFLEVQHDACSQQSAEEAGIIRELVENLLTQRYRDKDGVEHSIALENILVVAPYNAQVNLLTRMLPRGARVGTVDKFQGQEAEVVIVSMTTSSGDYLPRFMDFLYSKNRLNVAISRARCLAVVVANPALLTIPCRSPEDMALVNTLCWVKDYSIAPSCGS
ncbi:MAG: TM0106 family RecB-like putative nuclease, partial [Steroidobacteraceae bacterium]|nr:TM0106 family RecB-like putative nuclease [Steroidobacteraceae bacterium]